MPGSVYPHRSIECFHQQRELKKRFCVWAPETTAAPAARLARTSEIRMQPPPLHLCNHIFSDTVHQREQSVRPGREEDLGPVSHCSHHLSREGGLAQNETPQLAKPISPGKMMKGVWTSKPKKRHQAGHRGNRQVIRTPDK